MAARPGSVLALAALLCAGSAAIASPGATAAPAAGRNIIIFVADGLRRGSVNEADAPTLLRVRRDGVDFENSHALFPTVTTANASAIATGHLLGDTGNYANALFPGFAVLGTLTPFLESDPVLADLDAHFGARSYLNEVTLLALARTHGYATAAIGKLGPAAIQDVTELAPVDGAIPARTTLIVDDATGSPRAGVALPPQFAAALTAAGLPAAAPPRDQAGGSASVPGTLVANVVQQRWFADVTTRVVLPEFAAGGRPFALVYWSRDPDGTQHNQGDSLNRLTPGINGPTSRAAVANADANLRQILDWLDAHPDVRANTDVIVTSDHGFATLSRHEIDAAGHPSRSYATGFTYLGTANDPASPEVPPGWLPPGFLAIDLAHALGLPLHDPDTALATVDPSQPNSPTNRQHPALGNGALGPPGDAKVVVAANGGSDLIYVAGRDRPRARALVRTIVAFLARQDYTGAIFADSRYGRIPGALPLAAIGLEGSAITPRPAIVVSFRSFATDPGDPLRTAVLVSDTILQEGQGMHGSLTRDNTLNNMAAIGPDFKRGFVDPAPASNADLVRTVARILGWTIPDHGHLTGRTLEEALVGGPASVRFRRGTLSSRADPATRRITALHYQTVARERYLDAARLQDNRPAAR